MLITGVEPPDEAEPLLDELDEPPHAASPSESAVAAVNATSERIRIAASLVAGPDATPLPAPP
jgi:hypothetical protein